MRGRFDSLYIDGELERLGHAALGFVVELDTVFFSHRVKRPCVSTLALFAISSERFKSVVANAHTICVGNSTRVYLDTRWNPQTRTLR